VGRAVPAGAFEPSEAGPCCVGIDGRLIFVEGCWQEAETGRRWPTPWRASMRCRGADCGWWESIPSRGGRPRQVFYSTESGPTAEQILTRNARRWAIEQTFPDSKTHLGLEEPQGWPRRAVERTAPNGMLFHSLIVPWCAAAGQRCHRPLDRPWYTTKRAPSLAHMVTTLRRESVRQEVLNAPPHGRGGRRLVATLIHLAQQAACECETRTWTTNRANRSVPWSCGARAGPGPVERASRPCE
jgi:hypothetical protein